MAVHDVVLGLFLEGAVHPTEKIGFKVQGSFQFGSDFTFHSSQMLP